MPCVPVKRLLRHLQGPQALFSTGLQSLDIAAESLHLNSSMLGKSVSQQEYFGTLEVIVQGANPIY